MGGDHGLGGLLLGVLHVAQFLEQERGPSAHEGVRRRPVGEGRDEVAVLRMKTSDQVENLAGLGDRVADVAKGVGQSLEASC